jgi:glutamyl/glutaminyl-tRNA synthetase
VFDTDKLAWVNRHYLKSASPERVARLAVPYLQQAGWVFAPDQAVTDFLQFVVPAVAASVDRLDQLPGRLRFLFDYSASRALENDSVRAEAAAAASVIGALAEELAGGAPMIDREAFRAVVNRVRDRTGQKGRSLLHPIRLVLTGESEGLELDLAVPAMERGARLESGGIRPIIGASERAGAFRRELERLAA